MAEIVPSYLYKETRLNLESAVPASTVLLRLPAHGLSSWTSRTAQKRPLPTDVPPTEDENAFKQRYLASAASIYHRKHHTSPRSFLWRILEDGKVLAIRAVDLSKQDKGSDPHLTLRLYFSSPIRPYCVAFADSKDHDTLNAFVVTESNHLYTITFRPDFFVRRSSTDDNIADWCKTYSPTGFSSKYPHRLIALSSKELIASLHDGGFLRLGKKPGEHGAAWDESHYNEGGWGLRSLIPFQGNSTVQYGKVHMELSAITSMASPATIIGDNTYIFTVSLDHRLRIWNLESRKVAYSGDLLDEERAPNELGRYIIQPTQANLVKVCQEIGGKPLAVTYSPGPTGQFKLWSVHEQIDGELELEDLFPDDVLEPPTPTSDVWTLADFTIANDKHESANLSIWVLWKNNLTYRVQKVDLVLNSTEDVRTAWRDGWVAVAGETSHDTQLPVSIPSDVEDATQKWLDHILYPGRFTTPTIETALSLYERGVGSSKGNPAKGSRNLAERICSVIGTATQLGRSSNGMDFDGFRNAVDAQWRRFYRLVSELDKQRGEALSLTYDPELELATVVAADGVAVLRECSSLEKLWLNADGVQAEDESASTLVLAAAAFRDTFSDGLLYVCKTMLRADLFQESSLSDSEKLRAYYDNCNFAGQISDDDYAQLLQNLGGNFKTVTEDAYESLFESLLSAEESDERLESSKLAEFGMKTVIKGVQETIALHQAICFDQMALLAFIEGEIDQEEEGISLDTGIIYKRLVIILRKLELLSWLCKVQVTLPLQKVGRTNTTPEKVMSTTKKPDDTKTVTVLSASLAHLLGLITHSGSPTSSLLTDLIIRICHPDSEYMLQPVLIQCFLLKIGRADLAEACTVFCDQDPFSIYIQGRVQLAIKDLPAAAACFKKAAFGLSLTDARLKNDRYSAGLLDETEKSLLYSGLPQYYSHIVSLFDHEKSYSFVIDFARLGLQFCRANVHDDKVFDIKTDLNSRLFNSALNTSRFDLAYSTLTIQTNEIIQHSSLRALVSRMCETNSASQLIELPFLGLQDAVDAVLQQKCQAIVDVTAGLPYHQILYAWRIKHNDFRGAAAVSLTRLQKLQAAGTSDKLLGDGSASDGLETQVTRQYLSLINALSCVDSKQAWILADVVDAKRTNGGRGGAGGVAAGGEGPKRRIVTLEEVRRDYQAELDRIAAIENNQFSFAGGDAMDLL